MLDVRPELAGVVSRKKDMQDESARLPCSSIQIIHVGPDGDLENKLPNESMLRPSTAPASTMWSLRGLVAAFQP
jgi:hypothetical protein